MRAKIIYTAYPTLDLVESTEQCWEISLKTEIGSTLTFLPIKCRDPFQRFHLYICLVEWKTHFIYQGLFVQMFVLMFLVPVASQYEFNNAIIMWLLSFVTITLVSHLLCSVGMRNRMIECLSQRLYLQWMNWSNNLLDTDKEFKQLFSEGRGPCGNKLWNATWLYN